MIIRPKVWQLDEEEPIRVSYGPGNVRLVECEVVTPPSQAGRTVWLWLTPDEGLKMLRAVREQQVDHRSKPLSEAERAEAEELADSIAPRNPWRELGDLMGPS